MRICSITAGISFSEDFRALDCKATALLAFEIDLKAGSRRLRKRRKQPQLPRFELLLPFAGGQVECIRRHRFVGRSAKRSLLKPFLACLIMIRNGFKAPRFGILGEVIERDDRVRQVVEQRGHALVKERQPMLHARIAAPGGDGFIERVVALRRSEQLDIALAEVLDRRLARRHLADGQKRDMLARGLCALRDRIELPDAFERVAKEIEAHRARMPRREEVEDAAAHRVFARLHDRARAIEARRIEPLDDLIHAHTSAGREPCGGLPDRFKRRHALKHSVHRRQHDDRGLAALRMGEPRECGNAAGFDVAVR